MPAYLADVKTQGMGSQAAININFGSFIDLLTLPSPRAMLLGHSCHPLVLKEENNSLTTWAPVVWGVLIKKVAKELFLFQNARNKTPELVLACLLVCVTQQAKSCYSRNHVCKDLRRHNHVTWRRVLELL